MKKILILLKNDLKNIMREWMLLYIAVLPLIFSLLSRWLIPILTKFVAKEFQFNLIEYYPLITGYFILFMPILLGMVAGFLLLDEKDDGVMMALIITPLSKKGYILYRMITPLSVGFLCSLIIIPILNLVNISFTVVVPIVLLSALGAPLVALFLVSFAGNKVEGLALSKGLGILMLAPMAMFIESRWSILAGVVPFYWPVHSLLLVGTAKYWLSIFLGVLVYVLLLAMLLKKFLKKL